MKPVNCSIPTLDDTCTEMSCNIFILHIFMENSSAGSYTGFFPLPRFKFMGPLGCQDGSSWPLNAPSVHLQGSIREQVLLFWDGFHVLCLLKCLTFLRSGNHPTLTLTLATQRPYFLGLNWAETGAASRSGGGLW